MLTTLFSSNNVGRPDWLIDWLIEWLIDWLIDRWIVWLIDWLVNWLIFHSLFYRAFWLFFATSTGVTSRVLGFPGGGTSWTDVRPCFSDPRNTKTANRPSTEAGVVCGFCPGMLPRWAICFQTYVRFFIQQTDRVLSIFLMLEFNFFLSFCVIVTFQIQIGTRVWALFAPSCANTKKMPRRWFSAFTFWFVPALFTRFFLLPQFSWMEGGPETKIMQYRWWLCAAKLEMGNVQISDLWSFQWLIELRFVCSIDWLIDWLIVRSIDWCELEIFSGLKLLENKRLQPLLWPHSAILRQPIKSYGPQRDPPARSAVRRIVSAHRTRPVVPRHPQRRLSCR